MSGKQMSAKPRRMARPLSVTRCEKITPNMRRITLAGDDLDDFPESQEGGYIKLMLPCPGEEPYVRTYTIRNQDSSANSIDVDFALHPGTAPASSWAQSATVGDEMTISGPGPKKLPEANADWFFIAGDMTALPAISVNLEHLPSDAIGYVVIEVLSVDDAQPLQAPEGIDVHWVVNAEPGSADSLLAQKVESLPWLDGRVSAWAACEFSTMKRLRKYFRIERQVPKTHLYVSSYWKQGVSEDQHKRLKRQDAEENDT